MENLHLFEIPWIILLQTHRTWMLFLRGASYLGAEVFYLIIPALFLGFNRRIGIRFIALFALCNAVTNTLKLRLHWPRPDWVDSRIISLSPIGSSYAMPSGHALLATALWLYLALEFRRRWSLAAATGIILIVCVSRVYLGVHFPSDVLAGASIGLVLLAVFRCLWPRLEPFLEALDGARVILVSAAGSVAILGLHTWLIYIIRGDPDPVSWKVDPILIRSLDTLTAGILLGFGIGLAAARRCQLLKTPASVRQQLLEFLIGGLCFAILLLWLRDLLRDKAPLWAAWTEYPRAALAGFCLSFIAPWVGATRKIAQAKRDS